MNDELYKIQIQQVKKLGETIGYGNLMDIASVLWAHDLSKKGTSDIGAFYPMIITEVKDEQIKDSIIEERQQKISFYAKLGIWD